MKNLDLNELLISFQIRDEDLCDRYISSAYKYLIEVHDINSLTFSKYLDMPYHITKIIYVVYCHNLNVMNFLEFKHFYKSFYLFGNKCIFKTVYEILNYNNLTSLSNFF
jgi:hypothetical protein